ncbi:MAG: hypothetical protein KKH83_05375, partial [Candidatus Margulisbacteria bacterium]|nr:hypothetical protein [Candidatus Margulisiibacteriota bacterium]
SESKSFLNDYSKIRDICGMYSGSESAGVSFLYKYSYLKEEAPIILLDIEIAMDTDNDDKDTDRIDILLFNKKDKSLKFLEGKLYSNNEIRSTTSPKVIKQVKGYNVQIANKREEILTAYSNYINIVNEIFDLDLPRPSTISPETGLYIFDFDSYQLKHDLKEKILPKLKKDLNYLYYIGNPEKIKIHALWDGKNTKCTS